MAVLKCILWVRDTFYYLNVSALYDDQEPFSLAKLGKWICKHWRQTMACEGQNYVFFLPVQDKHSCAQCLCTTISEISELHFEAQAGAKSMCKVNGHLLWCISATSAFLVSCIGKPFLNRKHVSRLNALRSRWEMEPNNMTLPGEGIMWSWEFRSHASSFHCALSFQKRLRHLSLCLRSSYSLPHQPPPPRPLACLIKLLFRKWCSCSPSSSSRGYPDNPLFLLLSSNLSSLPSPTYLIRVSPFLFNFRAATFERLPNFSPVVTLQSE